MELYRFFNHERYKLWTLMSTEKFIKDLPFFSSFDDEQVKILSEYIELKSFNTGDTLLKQGYFGNELLIIKSGNGNITVCKPGDMRRHIANTQIGNCYGEVSMLSGDIITASIEATEAMECYSFSREKLIVLRILLPHLAIKIEHAIAVSAVKKIETMIQLAKNIYSNRKVSETSKSFESIPKFNTIHNESYQTIPNNPKCKPLMNKIPIFEKFNEDEVIKLFKYCTIISYEKGARVQYDKQHSLDSVCTGVLQVYDGVLSKISFIEPGSLYGQLTYFDEHFHLNAFCRENTILIRFEMDKLKAMYKENLKLWSKFHTVMSTQVVKFLYDVDRLILRLESEG
jgi:signal-transduction protein with cAMP-binding, CBS, and nucleotidyltransferase domain